MISFTAEESGLLGSEFYAANPVYPLAKTVGGFNIDAMNVYGRTAGYRHHRLRPVRLRRADRPRWPGAGTRRSSRTPTRPRAAISAPTTSRWPSAACRWPMATAPAISATSRSPSARRPGPRYGRSRYHQADDEWSPDWDLTGQVEDLQVLYDSRSATWPTAATGPQWKPGSEFAPGTRGDCG